MQKILITADKRYSLGAMLDSDFSTEYEIIYNAYDLKTKEGRDKLCVDSLDVDIFINSANLGRAENYQVVLLQELYTFWRSNDKKGLIVNIGSEKDNRRHVEHLYNLNKRALRDLVECIRLNKIKDIRVSLLSPGLFENRWTADIDEPKLDMTHISNALRYVISQPDDIAVSELRIEQWK